MKTTKIEWTDKTWNPITGCTKRSTGCAHCYAEVMSRRLKAMGLEKYRNGFHLTLHEDDLEEPLQWKKPHNIFVCSMSDIFHEEVPFEFVDRIMETIRRTPQHRYQILTKSRIDHLRKLNASIKFLSCEPLVEDLGELDLRGIDWIIVGGESGPQARPMLLEWVVNIKQQVEQHGAAFFFKQWGTWGSDGVKRNKHANGKLLFGEVIQQMPEKMAV